MSDPGDPSRSLASQITDWPSLLDQIRRRPGMWLGTASIERLRSFLGGIDLAEHLYHVPAERALAGFSFVEFEEWVEERFNPRRMSVLSFELARDRSDSQEEALTLWFT